MRFPQIEKSSSLWLPGLVRYLTTMFDLWSLLIETHYRSRLWMIILRYCCGAKTFPKQANRPWEFKNLEKFIFEILRIHADEKHDLPTTPRIRADPQKSETMDKWSILFKDMFDFVCFFLLLDFQPHIGLIQCQNQFQNH